MYVRFIFVSGVRFWFRTRILRNWTNSLEVGGYALGLEIGGHALGLERGSNAHGLRESSKERAGVAAFSVRLISVTQISVLTLANYRRLLTTPCGIKYS